MDVIEAHQEKAEPDETGASMPEGAAGIPDAVLSDIKHLMISGDSPARVLDALAEALSELVPHDRLTLFQAEAATRTLRPVLGGTATESADEPIDYGDGIVGKAAETREPQLVNEAPVHEGASNAPGPDWNRVQSLLAVPVLAHGELKGVLSLSRRGQDRAFSIKEFKLAVLFADLAALAIDDAQIRATLETEVVTDHLTGLRNHRFFHERLAEEVSRAHRQHGSVGLVIYDIDDFKRVNDSYGHQMGDRVLQSVAAASRETCRSEDVICRIGGEEFGIILPGSSVAEAEALAERVREAIRKIAVAPVGRVTVSLGVAEGPLHASSPRELITCADFALLEAKDQGKDQVRVYTRSPIGESDDDEGERPHSEGSERGSKARYGRGTGMNGRLAVLAARGEPRSVAQLRVLQSLGIKLNRLNDVKKIGEAITAELRSLIDYQNCRVHLLEPDRETLVPVGFQGELLDYQRESFPELIVKVGQGVTGHVAQTGESYYTPNAREDPVASVIPGRADVDESILGVPLLVGEKVMGTIVISKLGIDQFDDEDRRLMEGMAASAAIAMENAHLLQREREAAELGSALLELSEHLTRVTDTREVMNEALASIPDLLGCPDVGIWLLDREDQCFRLITHEGFDQAPARRIRNHEVPMDVAAPFVLSVDLPFVLPKEIAATVPEQYRLTEAYGDALIAPIKWAPDGLGAIVLLAPDEKKQFSDRDLNFVRGIADITSLALGNAARFGELHQKYASTAAALADALEARDDLT